MRATVCQRQNGGLRAYAPLFFGVVRQALLASVAYSLEFSYNACKNAVCESRLWDARLFGRRFIFCLMRRIEIMKLKTLAFALILGCVSVGQFSCASTQTVIPTRTMPAGASFSGRWYSNFGDMRLTQKADGYTRGEFDYKSGGSVEGKVVGGVFIFDWIQFGDFQVGRREVFGKAYLVISDDGLTAEGKWGYGDNYDGGGIWTAQKAPDYRR